MKMNSTYRKTVLALLLAIGLCGTLSAQQIHVHGVVVSADEGSPLSGVTITVKHKSIGTRSDVNGKYSIITAIRDTLCFTFVGCDTYFARVQNAELNVALKENGAALEEAMITGYASTTRFSTVGSRVRMPNTPRENQNTEEYKSFKANRFQRVLDTPLSTFSIDVDAASYTNARRFINNGTLPPKDAIRTEEFLNYFTYDYPAPKGDEPVSITTEVSSAPWNREHRLVHIGIKAKEIAKDDLPASNLVFLVDVSGSMDEQNKLPLLQASLKLLVQQLRPRDRVAIVTYANQTQELLPSTSGDQKNKITSAIESMSAGGGTAGGDGIQRAYRAAETHFIKGGNNRVILATDGDFNIGTSSLEALEKLIAAKRSTGIYLTVLGFGMGNYKDNRIQLLAEKGNGNNAYIDNLTEAKKVLVNEFGGTLFTVAKDVKMQVEFNPARVQAYRLIGYESRLLEDQDFNDDTKDAGEIGSGHSVTALYEIIPVGVESRIVATVDPLKYQKNSKREETALTNSPELFTLKLRYQQPDSHESAKMEVIVTDTRTPLNKSSDNFRFAAAIAGFGMLLQNSDYKNDLTYETIVNLARKAVGNDPEGYRKEFIRLVESAALLEASR